MRQEICAITLSFCITLTVQAQHHDPFGEISKGTRNSTLNMHLAPEGAFEIGNDRWGPIVRVNMLKIQDWSCVPCVKKAWTMKGYEGEDGMAFHPVISEVKDVDADGTPDIFRCRSEHEGARIERLRYGDGGVVWESEPMAALHGDESRLPVFDLDGDGVYSVLHATQGGTWCVSAKTGRTEWSVREAVGDIIVGHFLDKRKQAVVVRSEGVLRCYDHTGTLQWTHDTGLKGGAAYAHEAYRHDADGDGLDEIFANWQKLTMALKGNGTVLWKDKTQRHHSDYLVCGDVDADGRTELIYDHEGCDAEKGPAHIVDAMTGSVELQIDYRKAGLRHAQNMALGDFVPGRPGLEIALCGKRGHLFVWDAAGTLLWKRAVPASLLSAGDWDGDGVDDISCYALGANVDGMFSVWNGAGQRLYALSFLPSPSRRTWSDQHNGGSWSHAMPGGHEGIRRQVDLDGNGRVDVIMPFGAWHWGSDSILFLMEGPWPPQLDQYNVVWTSQSRNSSESMPVSGHDIGLNVWVENNELLLYIGRAGYRDENGALLKAGRVRVRLTPNPFEGGTFRQELKLREGYVEIRTEGSKNGTASIKLWVEVDRPIAHVDVVSDRALTAEATYESWRHQTIELPNDRSKHDRRAMCMINYDAYPGKVFLHEDVIRPAEELVRFHHRVDNAKDCFAFQVKQQELEPVRDKLVNPLEDLMWGGALVGDNCALAGETEGTYAACPFRGWRYVSRTPAKSHRLRVCLHIDQVKSQERWDAALKELIDSTHEEDLAAWKKSRSWWSELWNRSYLIINSGKGEKDVGWRLGRNYQLFRYMLAGNVSGREPTVFNGGLFTFDPLYVNGKKGPGYTPDHRQWGAAFTAQNQRLVYRPMLKTGDFDLLIPGFSYYLNGLPNAMARVRHYWKHEGCCFEEQSAITGLPGACQYGFFEGGRRGRPEDFEVGVQVNRAGGKVYEEQLDWSWLILQYHQFAGADIARYLPLIEQSVIFFDEHYRYRCRQLTGKELSADGKLVIYPANTLEAHWDARNPTSVIAGLRRVLTELITLPEPYTTPAKRKRWQTMLDRLPAMPNGTSEELGGRYLKPSETHGHQSWHCPEMFPLYPYELYGIGLPDLELMKRTSLATGRDRYATRAWEQANIHAARLGDTELARKLNATKMDNGPFRFPAFWPETIDWAPDHNWGGSGMVGMQEMLMQTHGGKIRLLPAWPTEWDVDFKLHAPGRTVVEGQVHAGNVTDLTITPAARRSDVLHKGTMER